jgi:prevent-host-death family protein
VAACEVVVEQIGVRELKEQASDILRRVREGGETFEVTFRGRVVARLIPVATSPSEPSLETFWDSWERLAAEVSSHWPAQVSAVDAIRDVRRDL